MSFVSVLKELEGLARGGKDRDHIPVPAVDPEHAAKVAEAAKEALAFLKSRTPGVKCVTTRGRVIPPNSFAMEEETEQVSNSMKSLFCSYFHKELQQFDMKILSYINM